jgi:tetracycline repressor-like protein
VLRAGIASGEFRKIDPAHFIPSMVALVIFYFASAPVTKAVSGVDPLSPEKLAERRAAVLDFISAALFRNHENQGARK